MKISIKTCCFLSLLGLAAASAGASGARPLWENEDYGVPALVMRRAKGMPLEPEYRGWDRLGFSPRRSSPS